MDGATRTLVELRKVAKSYGGTEVLHGVDLAISDGEFMTVLGPSGSGKTTILRLIGGLVRPTSGQVLLDGVDISAMPINRRPFNTVFQDYALFPHINVEANVAYGLKVRGVPRGETRRRVAETLRLVSLDGFDARYPAQLSGGQQQRVALARAIICQPRLILLDEPLGALDAELRRQMQRFLKQIQREIKTTFLFVTHDQEEAVTIADRICVMNAGRIEQLGSPQEVYYRPASEYVARFFGDNNLIEATAAAGAAFETAMGTFRAVTNGAAPQAGTRGLLLVRPEAIALGEGGDTRNRLRVRVEEASFVGPVSQVRVSAVAKPGLTLMVKLASRASGLPVAAGSEIDASWSERECHFVPA